PLALVRTLRVRPASTLVTVTVAPAAGAWSADTWPRTVAPVACACASGTASSMEPASATLSAERESSRVWRLALFIVEALVDALEVAVSGWVALNDGEGGVKAM